MNRRSHNRRSHVDLINGTSALIEPSQVQTEFAKDRWDARNIPGLRYPPHSTAYYIHFVHVPERFRSHIKEYAQFKIAEGRGAGTLNRAAYCLGTFLTFFSQHYPQATTLQHLCLQDIDAFILYLKTDAHARGLKTEWQYVYNHLTYLENFLSYLERLQHSFRPDAPTTQLTWSYHYPKFQRPSAGTTRHIPQFVLRQLETHMTHLHPTYLPVAILLRATAWRISDVLYLKINSCLEKDGEKYWLVGDIQKTRVLGHRIPITSEVAAVILAQREWVKQHYTPEENPQNWLFPASKHNRNSPRFRCGNPLCIQGVQHALDHLVTKYHIRDEQGNLFHIRLHAFRHTKGVELINHGMSLVMVQQWMAHASPEMTLVYARILDETMHMQWEKAVQRGIVQFNDGKPEYVSSKKMLAVINEPQAFDPARVREYRANTKLPVGNCIKPPKLICKFTRPTIPIGLRSTRRTCKNALDQLLPCLNKDKR